MVLCLITAGAVTVAPAMARNGAGAKPRIAGRLDQSFGKGGKATVAMPSPRPGSPYPDVELGVAFGPEGEILAYGNGSTLVELSADGTVNHRFAKGGRLKILDPEGAFQLAAIAVDSHRRIVVAGTTRPEPIVNTPGPTEYPGPPRAWATVIRYLPNGKPDPSFGVDGTITSDLGLPPPAPYPGGGSLPSESQPFAYETPSVSVTGLALDSSDRPVLTGTSVAYVTRCYPFYGPTFYPGAYVARLTSSGDPDPSFNVTGVRQEASLPGAFRPVIQSGRVLYSVSEAQCDRFGLQESAVQLVALERDGRPDPGFGTGGTATLPGLGVSSLALDSFGRILLAGEYAPPNSTFEPVPRVMHLTPNGFPDMHFGNRGSTTVHLPGTGGINAIGVDDRGRPLVAGDIAATPRKRSRFFLMRLTSTGRTDGSFGRHGWVETRFGTGRDAVGQQILIDRRGGIVVGGALFEPGPSAKYKIALARYLSGP